jgi:hypothetical protein
MISSCVFEVTLSNSFDRTVLDLEGNVIFPWLTRNAAGIFSSISAAFYLITKTILYYTGDEKSGLNS